MITSTNLKALRNLEAFQVYSDVAAFLKQEETAKEFEEPLKSVCDTFNARLQEYDVALLPERRSPQTAELAQLDARRDYILRSFIANLKLYVVSPDEEQSQAADVLLSLVEKYGKNIPGMPYRQETAAITNLLQDMAIKENEELVKKLFVEHWITSLRTANTQFEQTMLSRTDIASEATSEKSRTARAAVQTAFEKLCEMINALAVVKGEAAYSRIIDRINRLVREAQEVLARRMARNKKAVEKEEENIDVDVEEEVEE
ncbi:DUF6261 family protein [Odoribacter lunatus]|uniref:DUF6261 family protein n=1 Tax=Odoribacter lunatus TaxID=2941335 RepID=UPI00203BC45C|nr:DUF6261 family protein [Odoribacter lunatus]